MSQAPGLTPTSRHSYGGSLVTPPDPDRPSPPPGRPDQRDDQAAHDPLEGSEELDPDRTLVHDRSGPPPPPSADPDPGARSDPGVGEGARVETPAEAARRRRAERAREALVSPWSPARARRLRIIAAAVVIIGPLLGTLFALVIIPSDSSEVAEAVPEETAMIDVIATIRNVDATNGEATLRLVPGEPIVPGTAESTNSDLFEGPVLTRPVALVVNDVAGENVRVLAEGQTPGSLTVTVPLSDSRVSRYPLSSAWPGRGTCGSGAGPETQSRPVPRRSRP
ncbi:hypothetical protein BH24ACT4_BH24ACT4_15590 [soil metagenome]